MESLIDKHIKNHAIPRVILGIVFNTSLNKERARNMEEIKGNICLVEVGKIIYLIHKPENIDSNSKDVLKKINIDEVCNFN